MVVGANPCLVAEEDVLALFALAAMVGCPSSCHRRAASRSYSSARTSGRSGESLGTAPFVL